MLHASVCLKIPSRGLGFPPVRRRRLSGGVRVIHALHLVASRFVTMEHASVCGLTCNISMYVYSKDYLFMFAPCMYSNTTSVSTRAIAF